MIQPSSTATSQEPTLPCPPLICPTQHKQRAQLLVEGGRMHTLLYIFQVACILDSASVLNFGSFMSGCIVGINPLFYSFTPLYLDFANGVFWSPSPTLREQERHPGQVSSQGTDTHTPTVQAICSLQSPKNACYWTVKLE